MWDVAPTENSLRKRRNFGDGPSNGIELRLSVLEKQFLIVRVMARHIFSMIYPSGKIELIFLLACICDSGHRCSRSSGIKFLTQNGNRISTDDVQTCVGMNCKYQTGL